MLVNLYIHVRLNAHVNSCSNFAERSVIRSKLLSAKLSRNFHSEQNLKRSRIFYNIMSQQCVMCHDIITPYYTNVVQKFEKITEFLKNIENGLHCWSPQSQLGSNPAVAYRVDRYLSIVEHASLATAASLFNWSPAVRGYHGNGAGPSVGNGR